LSHHERNRIADTADVPRPSPAPKPTGTSAASANDALDDAMAMLGHELRNPLAAIRSAAELIKLTMGDDPRLKRTQAVLERQTSQMAKLIDGLLDVSRIVRGKMSLTTEVVDLGKVVAEVIQDRTAQLATERPELHIDLPPEPLWLKADHLRLWQVVDSLLSNAMTFTPPDGSVTVVARKAGSIAVLEIRDTGQGIDPELLPHVFEPFRQASQALDRSKGGLGLGLALVKGVVGLLGGSVVAKSKGPGRGAEFLVRLPLTDAPT
jgi:signal transduction histidine kinase